MSWNALTLSRGGHLARKPNLLTEGLIRKSRLRWVLDELSKRHEVAHRLLPSVSVRHLLLLGVHDLLLQNHGLLRHYFATLNRTIDR